MHRGSQNSRKCDRREVIKLINSGFTEEQVGEALGITQGHVSKILHIEDRETPTEKAERLQQQGKVEIQGRVFDVKEVKEIRRQRNIKKYKSLTK